MAGTFQAGAGQPRPRAAVEAAGIGARERAAELTQLQVERLRRRGLWGLLSLGLLRTGWCALAREPTPLQVRAVPRPPSGVLTVTWLGHATTMLTSAASRVLTDPFLTRRLGALARPYALPSPASDLLDVDLILVSSPALAHCHLPSLRCLAPSATLVVPNGLRGRTHQLGFADVIELAPGESLQHRDLTVHAHAVRDDAGSTGRGVAGLGYLIVAPAATCFFAGATGYFSGFAHLGRTQRPDVALLPITGYTPRTARTTHLSPVDALAALRDLRARFLVPLAHDGLLPGYEPHDEPGTWLRTAAAEQGLAANVKPLRPGQSLTLRRAVPLHAEDAIAAPGAPLRFP